MNCHQILSGACNAGDRCFAVGSVEGVPFTAYAAGCNIVILASTFERVQIIPGAIHNYIRISCLDCSTDTGKIAAAYDNQICVFEPTPLVCKNSPHQLDYKWVETASWRTACRISCLSWNLEGTRLLTGGSVLQLWHQQLPDEIIEGNTGMTSDGVTFEIGEEAIPMSTTTNNCEIRGWECVWQKETASPVVHIAFSPDGTLFATAGKDDRLVKIWFENKQLLFPSKSVDQNYSMSAISNFGEPNYGFVYIAHPRAVTQLSWRKTSKYMPKGSVSNMLVTSCKDNICRLWSETVLPDDGLVNMSHFDPLAAHNPRFRTHRHKHRLLQRLKHMKACFHIRRHAKHQGDLGTGVGGSTSSTIPTLPSTFSVHDFHSYGFHGTGIIPGLHFHLAASINAETDIPLVPSLSSTDPEREPNFVLHWLNNKEMHFSLQAEEILNELTKKVVEKDDMLINDQFVISEHHDVEYSDPRRKQSKLGKGMSQDESVSDEHSYPSSHPTLSNTTSVNSFTTDTNHIVTDSLDNKIECLLRDWHHSPDLLFAVHPIDGSYLIWVVDWLDEYHPGSFRQAQVSFSTRIPNAFPLGDATTMSHNVCLYHTSGSSLQLAFRDVVKTAAAAPSRTPSDVHGVNGDYGDSGLPKVLEEDGDSLAGDIDLHHQNELVEPSSVENGKTNRPNSSIDEDSGTFNDIISAPPCPTLSMVTKHTNGTLNLWQLTFADKSKFSQVLSIGHASRASGHRFRVNDVTCHPVLPLLLTTSHHNLPDQETPASPLLLNPPIAQPPTGFCSELILWRVDAVGPLSKSGGVSELARINSLQISAFSNVAWIPTLLPSTTLGTLSNSPSACFVASDGECLRVYQAVIDARTLLAEVSSSEHRSRIAADSMVSLSTDVSSENDLKHNSLHDHIKIVSQQSTARPGCIIQLDAISDATHDWQNTQFLHVFQEQLMTGERSSGRGLVDAISGLDSEEQDEDFEEPFYLVVLERTVQGTTVHMWRLIIASQPESNPLSESMMYVPDSQLVQDDDEMDNSGKMGGTNLGGEETTQPTLSAFAPHVSISTTKICTQELNLPDGVDVIHASPAGGHLSSASIYPACFAPYVFVTACSDSTLRFWKCKISKTADEINYQWVEWEMIRKDRKSIIEISGQPLNISAAYSGRIACAYKYGKSFTRPSKKDPESRYVNLCVAIYECESTGGSEWLLEDTIHMKNIHLPKLHIDPSVDMTYLHDQTILSSKKNKLQSTVLKALSSEDLDGMSGRCNGRNVENETNLVKSSHGLLAVPSFSTLQSLRKSIIENGNTCPLTQKHIVQLDWVSKEDGSHILTVAVGSKIMLFTPVSSDLAQANMKAMKESQSVNRPILRKASSLVSPNFVDEIRWMKLRRIDLTTADGLPPLPMQMSWVRDGILVVGMDSEMHVYSQWKPNSYTQRNALPCCKLVHQESDELQDTRNLRDEDLKTLAHETSQRRLANVSSMPHLSRVSSINLNMLTAETKKKKLGLQNGDLTSNMDSYMPDYGLFEAGRIACPVLPQYHPKQLMELLNSGKIRWVKAILAHLVRCISTTCSVRQGAVVCSYSEEDNLTRQRGWSRSRTLSVSYAGVATSPMEPRGSTTAIPEELMLDYAEITSIPPLPLWTLLAADKENASTALKLAEDEKDYNELFNGNISTSEDNLDDILNDESEPESPRRCERKLSNSNEKQQCLLSHFGPKQGQLLSRLLTHTHLPGLSSLDQMHLLALADTVSTCNTDFADRFVDKTQFAKDSSALNDGEVSSDSLDDCGLRFLLAMKHYNYLLRCLGVAQRTQFQKRGMCSADIAWAFHSESEEELLQLTPLYVRGTPRWSALKELGVGWWLRNQTLLRTCIEKIAKAAYQANQDPLDAAIFYLAMKKKSLVWGLFRSKRDERMTQFFSNNFAEDRWRKAALKNAFALLGKQRFEHAAAFFLLAGALRDAIEVCLNKLDDLQLAMVIARLYEGEIDSTPPSLKRLLYEEILGCDQNGENQKLSMANPDPFLRSMALWILKDFTGSLNTLVQTNVGTMHPQYNDEEKQETSAANPNVFNFYVYLRTHPLLIRHYLASTYQDKKNHTVVLAGFSYGSDARCRETSDRQLMLEDSISPLERQLYFKTAHAHFKAGCPALALEVLSKLPSKIMDPSTEQSNSLVSTPTRSRDMRIDTGILMSHGEDEVERKPGTLVEAVNPFAIQQVAEVMDWSAPVSTGLKDELELKWSDEEEDDEDDDDNGLAVVQEEPRKPIVKQESADSDCKSKSADSKACNLDVMAQQLKFVACLKILMEELSTLATGYEVDGGELRYHLYLWLEKEVDALRHLCNYSSKDSLVVQYEGGLETSALDNREFSSTPTLKNSVDKPTLHDILLAEKIDFEAKVQRAARRKKWLKENETLLRTLLSYCSLHGAGGGGLASVRMELVLLLQELQQEKTQQQLLSPLPFPTTLPLLSASVACNKTVIADPVRYLQAQAHDMLQTVIDIRCPPLLTRMDLSDLFVLRDLSVALSACFYQSLCDSDTIAESYQSGSDNPTYCSHLITTKNRKRHYSVDEPIKVTTPPSKWPGVSSLRALLAHEKDEDAPKLNTLLCEAFVATYMGLLVYAFATCDCHILYRLVGQKFSEATWSALFGGGVKKLLKVAPTAPKSRPNSLERENSTSSETGVWMAVTSLTKQKVRLNMKLLGQFVSSPGTPSIKEDKPTYREHFVPPEMSMISYFLNKPNLATEVQDVDYDSADSAVSDLSEDEDEDCDVFDNTQDNKSKTTKTENTEHSNPYSYAWMVMRLAIMQLVQEQLHGFLTVAAIDLQELPVSSPLIHGILRVVGQWQEILKEELESKGPPPVDYIPGCFVEQATTGPPINKYRTLLDKTNTPFHPRHSSAAPARRLWNYLVRQEFVQDLFIRSIFSRQPRAAGSSTLPTMSQEVKSCSGSETPNPHLPDPVRIIHKEQDSISAFCLNLANSSLLALATPREIQEMDISLLLESPSWLEDECEFDLVNLSRDHEHQPSSFLVIQTSIDRPLQTSPGTVIVNPLPTSPSVTGLAGQTGRGASVVQQKGTQGYGDGGTRAIKSSKNIMSMKGLNFPGCHDPRFCQFVCDRSRLLLRPVMKHRVDNIRRICPHPLLPVYLTGSQDGSVHIWEWGHPQAVAEPRPAGTFAKVTRVRFSQHGNKFGVADGDGNLSLFNVGLTSSNYRPFYTFQCHNKVTSDFVFLGSCSLIATTGHSSENRNVALWDTLLPHKKSQVTAFMCHEQGSTCIGFAPQHQVIVTGGRKGDICIFDVRGGSGSIKHRYMGHDSCLKCMTIDPHEQFYCTGSGDGEIKIWNLSTHQMMYTFPAEHARSSFFKHIGQGVTQLQVDSSARLFSCGADGSMKVRQLPDRYH